MTKDTHNTSNTQTDDEERLQQQGLQAYALFPKMVTSFLRFYQQAIQFNELIDSCCDMDNMTMRNYAANLKKHLDRIPEKLDLMDAEISQ